MQTKDEEIAEVQKRIQQLETDKESAQTLSAETNQKLEETEKRATEVSCIGVGILFNSAEAEVAALQKRIRQLEDELESTETRLSEATQKLEEASKAADESDRYFPTLSSKS
ncbi:hypothetical protein X801_05780 [Opisthorchis viverrini]|uniref:Tropomyosin n=1 Tax=Opisthorchis viverrini TaxID=6198 RepID=A0A1S8WV42_OPIVI|nr:hypothetical protein X801_05780 [Opisthorchis viverrini]